MLLVFFFLKAEHIYRYNGLFKDISDQMWIGVLQSFLISELNVFLLFFFMLRSNFWPQHSQAFFFPLNWLADVVSSPLPPAHTQLIAVLSKKNTKNKSFFQLFCQREVAWRCLIRLRLSSKFEPFLKIFFHPNIVTYSNFNMNVVTRWQFNQHWISELDSVMEHHHYFPWSSHRIIIFHKTE